MAGQCKAKNISVKIEEGEVINLYPEEAKKLNFNRVMAFQIELKILQDDSKCPHAGRCNLGRSGNDKAECFDIPCLCKDYCWGETLRWVV